MKLFELVAAYKASPDFGQLAPSSQSHYQQMIDAVYNWWPMRIDPENVTSSIVTSMYRYMVTTHGDAKAQQIVKVMRKIWNYGYRHELIVRNPWSAMGLKAIKPRTTVWSKEQYDIADIYARNEGYLGLRVLLKLLYATGQRPIDLLTLPRSAFKEYMGYWELTLTQKKTGKAIRLPITANDMVFIKDNVLYPWGNHPNLFDIPFVHNYRNQWATIRAKDPRLKDLQLRDLRRTVISEMADAGATDAQIRAVSGHSANSKIPETVYIQRSAKQAADGLALRGQRPIPIVALDIGAAILRHEAPNHDKNMDYHALADKVYKNMKSTIDS